MTPLFQLLKDVLMDPEVQLAELQASPLCLRVRPHLHWRIGNWIGRCVSILVDSLFDRNSRLATVHRALNLIALVSTQLVLRVPGITGRNPEYLLRRFGYVAHANPQPSRQLFYCGPSAHGTLEYSDPLRDIHHLHHLVA